MSDTDEPDPDAEAKQAAIQDLLGSGDGIWQNNTASDIELLDRIEAVATSVADEVQRRAHAIRTTHVEETTDDDVWNAIREAGWRRDWPLIAEWLTVTPDDVLRMVELARQAATR